jgi:hypothetical protein
MIYEPLALAMGFEPTVFSVTGRRVNRATPREHVFKLEFSWWLGWGLNPRPRAYESHALPTELPSRVLIRGSDFPGCRGGT